MDNLNDKSNYKKIREDKYKQESKDRLSRILKKKIQTTMIGALSSIEDNFSFLWTSSNGKLTKEQQVIKDIYQKVRSEILDKGNNQARNIDAELAQYDIEWLRYSIKIPVIQPENK